MSFLSKIFKKKPGGTFLGNLLRGAVKQIPIVGEVVGNGANKIELGQTKTNAQLQKESLTVPSVSEQIATTPPTPANIMGTAGYPSPSAVFQTGQADNPNQLANVGITAPRINPIPVSVDVDWKNGRVQYGNTAPDNSMLLYGMLGLGALMMLNKNK
ncbi:hypothetical protein H7F33_07125 [Pedobacter sp. PAMC26386]|nr:hypothetical protein H7F33_07125 [Pedobacter sp. PAMC26386]